MPDLQPGASWGPFRIESVIGRGPGGIIYRAVRTADGGRVSIKVFNVDVDADTLRRIEDDTRRLIGLNHPNILKVESVAKEGTSLHIVPELFEGRSLRGAGSRPRPELGQMLLKCARGVGAAWMRLILHRNLKPENILVSTSGDVKLCDFGQFREETPYWSPERKTNRTPDLRGDLYSLGTIFKEIVPPGDADLDALLHQMTRVETFERIQMVEDAISKLESWSSKTPSLAAPVAPPAPSLPRFEAPAPPPTMPRYEPPPSPPPWIPPEPSWGIPDPALTEARARLIRTLGAVTRRFRAIVPPPPPRPPQPHVDAPEIVLPTMPAKPRTVPTPPAPPKPKPVEAAPPAPPPKRPPKRRPSGARGVLKTLVVFLIIAGFVGFNISQRSRTRQAVQRFEAMRESGRAAEVRKELEARIKADEANATEKELLERIKREEWDAAKEKIRKLDTEGSYGEALKACEDFLKKNPDSPPEEAVQLKKSLATWVGTVTQAEQSWKYGGDRRAADLLARAGPARAEDAKRLISRWCDADWSKAKTAVAKAASLDDPYSANLELDRFLKKVHEGGAHKKEAQDLQLKFQADIEYPDVKDRIDSMRSRSPADAAKALTAFLEKPHHGGVHREEVAKQIAQLEDELKQTLFSGRVAISRLAVSPDGKRVAFTSDGVRILDLATREEIWTAPARSLLRGLAFAGPDRLVTGASNKITLWDIPKKSETRSFVPLSGFILGFGVKADVRTLVAVQADGTLLTWNMDNDEPPAVEKDVAVGVLTMSTSADSSKLGLFGRDKFLRLRDLADGKERKWAGPPLSVVSIAVSPDGARILAGALNGSLSLWTASTGESGPELTGHTGSVTCTAFSPDGKTVATGGADSLIRIASVKD